MLRLNYTKNRLRLSNKPAMRFNEPGSPLSVRGKLCNTASCWAAQHEALFIVHISIERFKALPKKYPDFLLLHDCSYLNIYNLMESNQHTLSVRKAKIHSCIHF